MNFIRCHNPVFAEDGFFCIHRGGPMNWDYVGWGKTKSEALNDSRKQEQEDWEDWKTESGRDSIRRAERAAEECQKSL